MRPLYESPFSAPTGKGDFLFSLAVIFDLHEMMADVQSGRIEKVVVYRLDRISRSILDFADFINILESNRISFVSATEKFDTSTPMGRAMLYIIVVFAQLERETIAERVRDNYYARVKKGAWGGGPAAFGFDLVKTTIDGKKATICQPNEQISVVQRIFELYALPYSSLADVQRQLIQDGSVSSGGVNFDNAKLSSILKNPTYVRADTAVYNFYKANGAILANPPEDFDGVHGCILVGKRDANERKYKDVSNHLLAMGHHEGIVDSTAFLFCQQKLSRNRQIKNTYKGKHSWLTGLVKCAHCGYAFSIRFSKTKDGQVPYFCCSGKYLHKACTAKQTHRVREIEAEVQASLIQHAASYNLIHRQNTDAAAKELQSRISEIDAKIENLILSLESVSHVSAQYINQRQELQKCHENVKKLTGVEMELFRPPFGEYDNHRYNETISEYNINEITPFSATDWEQMDIEQKRQLARSLIRTVYLSEDGLSVSFNIKNGGHKTLFFRRHFFFAAIGWKNIRRR